MTGGSVRSFDRGAILVWAVIEPAAGADGLNGESCTVE